MFPKFRKILTKARNKSKEDETSEDVTASQTTTNQDSRLLYEDEKLRSQTNSTESLIKQDLHFIVDYLGYCQVSEVQSISLLLDSVKRVKKSCAEPNRVDFVIKEGVLKISSVGCHSLILTVPLYIVALCAQESLRSFDKCFGINITRKNAHLCYVFQAGSSLEASSIVRSVAISFKSLGQMLRDKKAKIRQSRRGMKQPLYHQSSVGSDWSSQSGYYNDSSVDPWLQSDTCSRVSSTTSRGSEHPRQGSINRHSSIIAPSAKRSSTHHSFKHVEFTPLSPVPSNNSSVDKSVENIGFKAEKKHKIPAGEKRKGELQVEVDVHTRELGQKLGRIENMDETILQELTFDESKEEAYLATYQDEPNICVCAEIVDERLESVLSAIQRGSLVHLESYLDEGVDVDLADSTRRSLLFHAVNYGQISAVQLLLDRGATVNWEGPNDMSPLHQAAANRDKSIAQVLLAKGANVRAKDCEFRTPLHMCAGHPSGTELSCILVEHGARIYDNSIDGTRPLDLLPDLKELQSRLVQSVCEAFMSADPIKSRSHSAASQHSFQSVHSVMSGGSLVAHLGSLRNLYNQSPQLRHARRANHQFTANFDLGSFQWKKDSRCMMEDNTPECATGKQTMITEDNGRNSRIEEDIPWCPSCPTRDHYDKKTTRKPSFQQETWPRVSPSGRRHRRSRSIPSPGGQSPGTAPSFGPDELGERVVAEHQSGSTIIGSVNTWTGRHGGGMLMSSTPADVTHDGGFGHDDVTHDAPSITEESADSGVRLKDDYGTISSRNQDSSAGPSKDTASTCPHDTTIDVVDAKELLDRSRERTRSNADSCYSSISPCSREEDPVLLALSSLVKLSFNPECQPLLLCYLCLPKASSQLSVIVQSPVNAPWVAEAVAILINNLASIEGQDSRRRAAEAGFIRTVLELATAQEPVQTTCLEVLDNLLKDVKNEREYNSTMTNIPSGPLLNLLHHHHPTVVTVEDTTISDGTETTVGEGKRNSSSQSRFNSCCHLSPRLVATRLLAASSSHVKMQRELGTSRAVTLLLEASDDINEEVVYNAVVTLANIAMFYDNHSLLHDRGAVEKLKMQISSQSRAYYHMTRALVYLKEDDNQMEYLFDFDEEDPQPIYTEHSPNQEPYIKGASLETLVRMLTSNAMALWGGVPLLSPSPQNRPRGTRAPKRKSKVTESHVIEFFLATYSTYTNAIVLMRLFIHRFHDPKLNDLFNEETGAFMEESHSLPRLHTSLMRIWVAWLEKFPGDFNQPLLQSEVRHLIVTLASYDGPYLVCAQRLQDRLNHFEEETSIVHSPQDHCHHDVLFRTCQQAIVSASLPAPIDDAIYLAALQLYIEISSLSNQSTTTKVFHTDNGLEKVSVSRIKFCLNPTFHKVKNVYKRVRTYYEQIAVDAPSQRKAKHDYIDCCQGMIGYGCKFFSVKESSCCQKSHSSKRLVGINPKEVVFLEAKSRNLLRKWDLNSLLGWKCEENTTTLILLFSESSCHLLCESKHFLERIQDTIKQCVYQRNCEGINENDFLPWSKRSEEKGNWGEKAMEEEINHRLKDICKTTRIFKDQDEWKSFNLSFSKREETESRSRRHSSPSSNSSSRRRHPHGRSPSLGTEDHSDELTGMLYSVGTLEQKEFAGTRISPRSNTSSLQSTVDTSYRGTPKARHRSPKAPRDQKEPTIEDDNDVMIATKLKICLCPPDTELDGFNRTNFTPQELLRYPRELARQITLIDHELLCRITNADILKRVSEGSAKKRKKGEESCDVTTVKMFSDRFNQLSSWVVSSLLKEDSHDTTAEMVVQYIETAKQCLELRNYNAMMAIGVGALCSAPVRRLRKARELIPKWYLDQLHIMEALMDSRENHKKYRESLRVCPSPAVPYFGVYLKDLIYISEGNPDYLSDGIINLSKRRLLYAVLHQVRSFQVKSYNFEQVPEIRDFLLNTKRYTEEELHRMSRKLDTRSRHTVSEGIHEPSISGILSLAPERNLSG